MAGLAWVQGLSRRNPMIASGKAQNLSTRRAQKLKRFIVIGHFSKLTTTLEEPGLLDKPERIYNVDDKGCRSYLHKQRRGRPGPSAETVERVRETFVRSPQKSTGVHISSTCKVE